MLQIKWRIHREWIQDNLETEVNIKSRMAAIYLCTTKNYYQHRIISSLYYNRDNQTIQDKLSRAVMEKVIEWEARDGEPLLIFTPKTLLEAEPDRYQAQQYFLSQEVAAQKQDAEKVRSRKTEKVQSRNS